MTWKSRLRGAPWDWKPRALGKTSENQDDKLEIESIEILYSLFSNRKYIYTIYVDTSPYWNYPTIAMWLEEQRKQKKMGAYLNQICSGPVGCPSKLRFVTISHLLTTSLFLELYSTSDWILSCTFGGQKPRFLQACWYGKITSRGTWKVGSWVNVEGDGWWRFRSGYLGFFPKYPGNNRINRYFSDSLLLLPALPWGC